ncbi:hypothetical protein ERO13_A09G245200v2 [Gossypium hirsutum]|uniref:Uncharacterized protein isoform X1 n=1 Tax=Gossypium hirsutum TaxID=3635 RepID=A0ABM2YU58_GOSHI|nr:uncharacterized protein LOC121206456 isoform X1 [Gossypium hirsutum]KAG4185646.1 hypothetical protein ERO13_A09G245200v2 [Gossypium hirsutum]
MFGRVRALPSPSSVDCFDTPPSKIIKDDSLSIYETTLMKLKLGSQRHLIPQPTTAADLTDCASGTVPSNTNSDDESMVIDTDYSPVSVSYTSSDFQSTSNFNSQQGSNGTSIHYLFSKFRDHQRVSTISDQTMTIESIGSTSFLGSIEYQSLSSGKRSRENHESSTSTSTSTSNGSTII